MNEWKDITSYSRGDRGKKPTSWELRKGPYLRIEITCGHIYYPNQWIMQCYSVNMRDIELNATTKEEAQVNAVQMVYDRLQNMIKHLI